MIKAIIYDVDGTLVDSEPFHIESWDKALQNYGHSLSEYPEDKRSSIPGKKPVSIAKELIEYFKISTTPESLAKIKHDIFMHLLKNGVKEMPGAVKSLQVLEKRGFILAIGTSQTRPYIDIVLDSLKIRKYFEVIVTGEEIKNGKPHPDTYLAVVKKLGLKSSECVVIGDAQSGIASAKAAGCYCIAVKTNTAIPQNLKGADIVIFSHQELREELLNSLEK